MMKDEVLENHILNIIQKNEIFEQSDLQKILLQRGLNIPQATLSRRLKKLNVAKVRGIYQIIGFKQANLPIILNLQISEFGLIILHTHPGNAGSLAYFFDKKYITYSSKNQNDCGILGTIAGDDTVLLIIKSKEDLKKAVSLIYQDFPYLSEDQIKI